MTIPSDSCGTGNVYLPTLPSNSGQAVPLNTGPSVADVIAQLGGYIEFTHLAQSLRERIDIITTLEDGFNNLNTLVVTDNSVMSQQLMGLRDDLTGALAYINTQVNIEISERQALVNSVTQLVAALEGGLTAALQDESTVRAEQTGALFAERTIKADLAGNVTGFGLSAYVDPEGNFTSDFQVRADTFSIAPPTVHQATAPSNPYNGMIWVDNSNTPKWYNSATAQWQTTPTQGAVPFIVKTTPEVVDGYTIPAGVYIDSAVISRITANQIDTRGLSIRDAQGNILFASGTSLDWGLVGGSSKPADGATKNLVYRQSGTPTGTSIGDLWVNTGASPVTVSQWTGSAWAVVSNNTTNTNQLTDGAGLGSTAIWSSVTGTGKPANNATVGAEFGVNIFGQITSATASTYIANAAIKNAHIGTAEVGTLTIAGNAVTVPVGNYFGSTASATFSMGAIPAGTNTLVTVSWSNPTTPNTMVITANGVQLANSGIGFGASSFSANVAAGGSVNVTFTSTVNGVYIALVGLKR